MIVFGAIVPHSPLLIPSIGKEHTDTLQATRKAFSELEQSLYLAKPDTIVIISPHAPILPDAFSGNASPSTKAVLKEFGDHGTTVNAKTNFLLLDHMHRLMRQENVPFILTSEEEIDYGFTVPLLLLTTHLQGWKLVPLAVSGLDERQHYEFGRQLKRCLHAESERIAIIASADLSHHASAASPQGETRDGKQFDATVREKAASRDAAGLLALDKTISQNAGQCGLKPILTLLGSLENINATATELCYEAPFGVGYLTLKYELA
jgi:aromatic ring-opening dioxygenase LigB subunit